MVAPAGAPTAIGSGANHPGPVLQSMDQSLQPLRANWTGAAASSYEASKAKWTSAITDMKALLVEIGKAVETSGGDYASTEASNAGKWA